MMFRTLAVLLLSSLAAAQVKVTVGPGLTFTPATITAPNGTVVEFDFAARHSATQSTFDAPCTQAGFNSARLSSGSFSIKVTDDSRPIWFYCNVAAHCSGGMVGVINAPASGPRTYDAFVAAARALAGSQPAQTAGDTAVAEGPGVAAATSGGASTTKASGSGTAPAATGTQHSSALQLTTNAGLALVSGALAFFAA